VRFYQISPECEGEVTLSFNTAQKALVYSKGVKSLVEVENNTLALPIGVGEGIFVFPFGA